jgi:hypothetical protein
MKISGISYAVLALVFALPMLPGAAQVAVKSHGGVAASPKPASKSNINATNCTVANSWQQIKLEESSLVMPAAGDFATQLASRYKLAYENKTDVQVTAAGLIAGLDNGLVDAVVSAANGPQSLPSAAEVTKKCTAASMTADTNKQTGAPSGSDGTTSTTELTGIPELLSIAVENGSVTNSVNGSTMTLSTSLYGLITGFGLAKDSSHNYDHCRFCVGLGASGTFNVANASSSLSSATRKDISQWQLKYSVFDKSTRSAAVKDLWKGSPQAAASQLAANVRPNWKLPVSTAYTNVETALADYTQANLDDIVTCIKLINAGTTSQTCSFSSAPAQKQPATNDGLANLILQGLDSYGEFQAKLTILLADADTPKFAAQYQASLAAYNTAVTKFEGDVDNLSKGWNADLTFGQQFPTTTSSSSGSSTTGGTTGVVRGDASATTSSAHLPDYLVGGLDVSWQPKTTQDPKSEGQNKSPAGWTPSWTFNGKSSFYTEPNTALNEKTFRGVQAATQFQWTLGASPFVSSLTDKSKITLALNGSYQRLPESKDQKGKRPDITSGSFKLTIPFPGGISFPLAVTYGNSQQQQTKGSYVIGNFGLSFDADKLAALLALKH